jgi:quinol monooxygenase YgiN
MYATVSHRQRNDDAHAAETGRLAAQEFFPAMKKAGGFVAFYVIAQEDGDNLAISVWRSKADAERFFEGPEVQKWTRTLDERGHDRTAGKGGGEVTQHLTAGT